MYIEKLFNDYFINYVIIGVGEIYENNYSWNWKTW